jgi:hypothetical protein
MDTTVILQIITIIVGSSTTLLVAACGFYHFKSKCRNMEVSIDKENNLTQPHNVSEVSA